MLEVRKRSNYTDNLWGLSKSSTHCVRRCCTRCRMRDDAPLQGHAADPTEPPILASVRPAIARARSAAALGPVAPGTRALSHAPAAPGSSSQATLPTAVATRAALGSSSSTSALEVAAPGRCQPRPAGRSAGDDVLHHQRVVIVGVVEAGLNGRGGVVVGAGSDESLLRVALNETECVTNRRARRRCRARWRAMAPRAMAPRAPSPGPYPPLPPTPAPD